MGRPAGRLNRTPEEKAIRATIAKKEAEVQILKAKERILAAKRQQNTSNKVK